MYQDKGDAPSNVGVGLVELFSQLRDCERNREEVKCIPRLLRLVQFRAHEKLKEKMEAYPSEEGDGKESPLHAIKHTEELDGILDTQHGWLE